MGSMVLSRRYDSGSWGSGAGLGECRWSISFHSGVGFRVASSSFYPICRNFHDHTS